MSETRRPATVAPRSRRTLAAYGYVAAVAVAAGGALGLHGTASAAVQLVAFVAMAAWSACGIGCSCSPTRCWPWWCSAGRA